MNLLLVDNVSKKFGGLDAIRDCSFSISNGQIVGLIGPNDSGKTTVFNVITGVLKPSSGDVYFQDGRITGLPPYLIAKRGISRTFQITRIFKGMTVIENLLAVTREGRSSREKVIELLKFVNLYELRYEYAGKLSYGQQKLLDFAKSLVTEPALVLLDEPTSGIYPAMIEQMIRHIQEVRAQGKTIFIIEHNMRVVMRLCEKIFVLDHGEKIAEGTPEVVRANKQVVDSYLGKRNDSDG